MQNVSAPILDEGKGRGVDDGWCPAHRFLLAVVETNIAYFHCLSAICNVNFGPLKFI